MAIEKICGVKIEDIRKSYFKGKLGKLLIDIQATGEYTAEDFKRLSEYLSTLKAKDEQLNTSFAQFLPKIDISGECDTVLDELNKESLSEAEIASLEQEKENREKAVITASKLLRGLFRKFYDPNIKSPGQEDLMDLAFEMLGLQYYLLRDELYKERLFRKKIVEYERAGKQRKTAEEYAKTLVEYRDWKLAEGLREQANELILLAKKRYKDI